MALSMARPAPLSLPSPRFAAVWQRHVDVFRHRLVSLAVMPALEPLLTFVVLGFGLGQFVDLESGQDYLEFLAPGMLAAFPLWQAAFVCSWEAWMRMESDRVYHAAIATPLEAEDVAAGDIAWAITMSLISTVHVLLMALAFGLVDSAMAALVLPVAVVHSGLVASIALAYTASIPDSSRLNYFFTVIMLPMFWMGDVFFPNEELPDVFATIGWFLPTTHTVGVYRDLLAGDLTWGALSDLAWIVVAGAALFQLALWRVRKRLVI